MDMMKKLAKWIILIGSTIYFVWFDPSFLVTIMLIAVSVITALCYHDIWVSNMNSDSVKK